MLLLLGYAYDVFNLGYSPWEVEGTAFPDYTFYSSVFNYAAGTYGGVVGGNHGKYGLRVKFFTSGSMPMTDENGDSLGTFSANFLALDGTYIVKFRGFTLKVGPSVRYASLSPQIRGVALASVLQATRTFPMDWGYARAYATVDGVGYELLPVGLRRSMTDFRAYAGGEVRYSHVVAQAHASYYSVGGPAFSIAFGVEYDLLRFKVGYDSHYSSLYGGYGRDRIAGTFFLFGLTYRNFHFTYTYNPLGVLGDRHILGIAYSK